MSADTRPEESEETKGAWVVGGGLTESWVVGP